MANTYITLDGLFTGIADAIRLKNGSKGTIVADTFPNEIRNLRTGFDYNNHNVSVIEDYQFKNCTDLRNVDCYNITSIGTGAFEGCSNLKTVVLYSGIESIGENAFKGCNNLIIYCEAASKPDTWHDNWNISDCKVVWGFTFVETWNISATENDNVTAELYNDIHNEGYYSLIISGSGNMKSYIYYQNELPPWHNYKDNIRIIEIKDGVISIGGYAFMNCTSLTSINIPDSVTNIGTMAFDSCINLVAINIPNNTITINKLAFDNTAYYNNLSNWENDVLYINNSLIEAKTTISGDYIIKDGTVNIAEEAFHYCKNLLSIIFPNSVTRISRDCFRNCESLTSINMPDRVTNIDGSAFYNCTSLTSIDIPDSVTSINSYAFYGCNSLTSINYMGTIAQWNAIVFGASWNNNMPNYTIHCTNGDITKDGTVIYYTSGGDS